MSKAPWEAWDPPRVTGKNPVGTGQPIPERPGHLTEQSPETEARSAGQSGGHMDECSKRGDERAQLDQGSEVRRIRPRGALFGGVLTLGFTQLQQMLRETEAGRFLSFRKHNNGGTFKQLKLTQITNFKNC